MTYSNLPAPLAAFLRAVQTRDADALLAAFAGAAVLHDCGEEHRGDEIGMVQKARILVNSRRAESSPAYKVCGPVFVL